MYVLWAEKESDTRSPGDLVLKFSPLWIEVTRKENVCRRRVFYCILKLAV